MSAEPTQSGDERAKSTKPAPGATRKLWGGRFQEALDPRFDAFNRSLGVDSRLWREDIEGSIAWTAALRRASV